MKLDMNQMKDLIVSQQLEIKRLKKKVDYLQDSHDKRQEWLSKAKREAGKDYGQSFDVVWKEMLDKPTWDDVRYAIELAQKECYDESGYLGLEYEPEEIIEQLKQSKTK